MLMWVMDYVNRDIVSRQHNVTFSIAHPCTGPLVRLHRRSRWLQMVAYGCNITLPRWDGDTYLSLLDECGGHTMEYHFHERMTCLYEGRSTDGMHSAQVAEVVDSDGQKLYGKWEDESRDELPLLDACGGHFGVTPESGGLMVYHYHIQDAPPFTVGCIGPNSDGGHVTIDQCRDAYTHCGNGYEVEITTTQGTFTYDPWCPCYDGNGSNVHDAPLPLFSSDYASAYASATAPPVVTPKSTYDRSMWPRQCVFFVVCPRVQP